MNRILLFFLLLSAAGKAQHLQTRHPGIPADTSFNTRSEYLKQFKNYPQISVAETDTTGIRVIRDLVYTRYGKRRLHLDIFMPAAKGYGILPVVILVHGGGWRSGDKQMDWPMAAGLAKRGFVTVCLEYRLSMEAPYPAAVTDIKTAIWWVRLRAARYGGDSEHLALLGTSAGGQLAALIGTINDSGKIFPVQKMKRIPSHVQAVVNIDGVVAFLHPESGEGADKPGKPSAATLWFGGNATQKPDLWQQASALSYVNARTAPMLFLNSSQPRFHAGREDFIAKLDSLGINNEVVTLENTPHTFWLFHPWFEEVISITTSFLERIFRQGANHPQTGIQ